MIKAAIIKQECGEKGNPCALLMGMECCTPTVGKNMESPQKVRNITTMHAC